ncbi:hypothetical protein KC726_01355 [Candidatus Woesebacteria bacterium]|nr:hypothetical protein [Candidatus Woesebacteria bacterium]
MESCLRKPSQVSRVTRQRDRALHYGDKTKGYYWPDGRGRDDEWLGEERMNEILIALQRDTGFVPPPLPSQSSLDESTE